MKGCPVAQYPEPLVKLTNQLLVCTHLHSLLVKIVFCKCSVQPTCGDGVEMVWRWCGDGPCLARSRPRSRGLPGGAPLAVDGSSYSRGAVERLGSPPEASDTAARPGQKAHLGLIRLPQPGARRLFDFDDAQPDVFVDAWTGGPPRTGRGGALYCVTRWGMHWAMLRVMLSNALGQCSAWCTI